MDQFWLTDEQFAKIEPLLPTDTRGNERVDDRLARNYLAAVCLAATVSYWL